MDATPVINFLSMGGIGYLSGIVLKTNPKLMAITWLAAEAMVQGLKYFGAFDKHKVEHHFRLVLASAACVYLDSKHCISKINHILGSILTFCIIPDLIEHSGIFFEIGKN